jgi:hypothetical protein
VSVEEEERKARFKAARLALTGGRWSPQEAEELIAFVRQGTDYRLRDP